MYQLFELRRRLSQAQQSALDSINDDSFDLHMQVAEELQVEIGACLKQQLDEIENKMASGYTVGLCAEIDWLLDAV